jgi:hypothetical protein
MKNNPSLVGIAPIVGDWNMELSNAPFLSDSQQNLPSHVSFSWIESSGLIAMRQGKDATWVIGRDEENSKYTILYYDKRGVSRVYEMSFENNIWKIWRNNPDFSQRYEAHISKDFNTITATWEKSSDYGKIWEHDFDMKFTRQT